MTLKILTAALLLAQAAPAAQPLPVLRTEPIPGGSIFWVKNTGTQPVTAFLIELVNYPGSYYSLWQDEAAAVLIAPGAEKRIQVTNMTVGAVPDYVKLQAALFADGSSAGIPEKVTQMVERRRFTLATIRELIARIEKAKASSTAPADLIAALKQWAESLLPARRADPTAQTTINNAAARGAISEAAAFLESHSPEETLAHLRANEKSLAAGKPAL
ncbi:MAG: hypothetical protein P4L56_00035 [Candidatus Sulfopaludibacter sp.]|nr:hypothetical protein [Candidatus Sulfopaludibacter sp.]